MSSNTSNTKVWLVTGASAGIGLAVTEHALAQGNIVVATARNPDALASLSSKYPEKQLLILKLDVTKPDDVKTVFGTIAEKLGRIDVVFSNAGYSVYSEIEIENDKNERAMFEVNYWGALNVLKASLRFFREVNSPRGGKLLVSSSVAGVSGMPILGAYSASKFASEGVHETAAAEVNPSWNIKIHLLEFGGFASRGTRQESVQSQLSPAHPAYADSAAVVHMRQFVQNCHSMLGDVKSAAQMVNQIANDDEAPLRIPVGMGTVGAVKKRYEAGLKQAEYGEKLVK